MNQIKDYLNNTLNKYFLNKSLSKEDLENLLLILYQQTILTPNEDILIWSLLNSILYNYFYDQNDKEINDFNLKKYKEIVGENNVE